ncbi:PadR family transcriptional regulator [bacterium]|nr:MAG: PadR family transcriptional regulator [bacterium]
MPLDRPLSTLESTALGIISKRGPCLAHAVVMEFAGSQTLAYRSGAGSIYPLLKRLTDAGLLRCEGREYSLTEAGRFALREWLLPSSGGLEVSSNLDALRSRTYFLKLLEPFEVGEFIDRALEGLARLLLSSQAAMQGYRDSGDRFSELAMLGAVRETEARIAWLEEVKEAKLGFTIPVDAAGPTLPA